MPAPPRAALLAVGLLPAAWALSPLLAAGGLAPLALALVVAGFAGAPLANLAWEPPPALSPARAATREAVAELCLAAWCATAAAGSVERGAEAVGGPAPAVVLVAGALFVGARLGRTRAAAFLPIGAAAAAAIGAALAGGAPWTLLEPHFETWRAWAAPAALLGLGLAGVGSGVHGLTAREPGGWRAPWGAVGLGLAFALLLAAREGGRFTVALGAPGPDPGRAAAEILALGAAAPALFRRPAWVLGAATALVLAGASATAATVLVPALAAASLSLGAADARGSARAGLGLGALGVLAAASRAPAWPAEVGPAAAVGALVVAGFWWAATRVTLAAREAS